MMSKMCIRDRLRSGVGVKAAFNAVHFDDIVGGVIQQTAQSVKQSTADNIRNRQQRPDENGISAKACLLYTSCQGAA